MYCENLTRQDEQLADFYCYETGEKVENAGACFVKDINGQKVMIELCPYFEDMK